MEGQLFQLLDADGDQVGLIWTDLQGERDYLEKDWKEFESDDAGADTFAEYLNTKYPNAHFEQVFVTELQS